MLNAELIKDNLKAIFTRYNVKRAVLFGSFAKGNFKRNSDVDIFVDSGLRGLKFYGLLEDISNALDRPVDLIDISQVKPNSRVMDEISKTGVVIYEK